MKKQKKKAKKSDEKKEMKYYCSVCGCEIDEDEYESFDGMCWDDQMTEESEDMFGDVMRIAEEEFYECIRCGRKITGQEFEAYEGMCEECYLIEIDELDYEDGDY